MWSMLLLLISYATLWRVWSTKVYFEWIFAWFQWFELSWLNLDISRLQINDIISFTHRLANKRQKILETNSMISRKPHNLFRSTWKQARQLWRHKYRIFVSTLRKAISGSFSWSSQKPSDFLILSTTVCAKPSFKSWFYFLLVWLMFIKIIFDKRKLVQISLHLTFKV